MFIQYYRYLSRYHCEPIRHDPHLQIVYPADEHGIITAAHDFYVIGTFADCIVEDCAKLTVELLELSSGEAVRTVQTNRKNGPLFADDPGIVTNETKQAVMSSGMPDLAYDPQDPDSFFYTWNKAYLCDTGFSALIYGGSYGKDRIVQNDQFGRPLQPLQEGFYEVRVTLETGGQRYVSAKKIKLACGHKEIILSRFSPPQHVEIVERFAAEQGFEPFTDPYAGIWDPQYFACPWPSKAYLEIPARWHWGDAQEYESGMVHCFDYNISEPCVSYQIEIANLLRKDANIVDQLDRLKFYYYPAGMPALSRRAGEQLEVFGQGKYAVITQAVQENGQLRIQAVYKPIPSAVRQIEGCEYAICNRIAHVEYVLQDPDGRRTVSAPHPVGVWKSKDDDTSEFLVLQSDHVIPAQTAVPGTTLTMIARDIDGAIWDEVTRVLE